MTGFSLAKDYLLLLWTIPLACALWDYVRRVSPIVMPFDHAHRYRGNWLKYFVNSANLIPALILVVAIWFLCGPKMTAPPKTKRETTNVMFALDASGSMMGGIGGGKTRYQAAIDAVCQFTSFRKGDSFGLTIFGTSFVHLIPVTQDLNAIEGITKFFNPRKFGAWFGGTQIGGVLRGCKEQLIQEEKGDRMIIIVSDGQSGDLGGGQDRVIGQELADENISVFLICVKSNPPSQMHTIASMTNGGVFQADDPAMLEDVFKQIDEMQKVKLKHLKPSTIDYFKPFAITGLVLLSLQLLAMFGLRYNPW